MLSLFRKAAVFLKPVVSRISSLNSNHYKTSFRACALVNRSAIVSRSTFPYANVVPVVEIDWSEKMSFEVHDQEADDCFLYAGISSIESALFIKRGISASVSASNSPRLLLDANPFLEMGHSGNRLLVLHFYMRMGYLFRGVAFGRMKDCEFLPSIHGYSYVPRYDVHAMEQAISHQPIIASIDSTNMELYNPAFKEIIDYDEALNVKFYHKNVDHAVLIVGYGETNGVKWWKCLNSWGADFGNNGYFKIARGFNIRGIEQNCCFPIVLKPHEPVVLTITCDKREILKFYQDQCIKIVVISNAPLFGGTQVANKMLSSNKIALYDSLGGVPPTYCLPVFIDSSLTQLTDQDFILYCNDLMESIKEIWGQAVLIHFKGFHNGRGLDLYSIYNDRHAIFIEEIHGIACLVVAGLIASQNLCDITLRNHKYMIYGSTKDLSVIASLIRLRCGDDVDIVILDDSGDKVLVDEIITFKPTALIGLSSSNCFDEEVVRSISAMSRMPIILAMGGTTTECNSLDALTWSDGNIIFGCRYTADPDLVEDCAVVSLIYPGIGLGMFISGAVKLDDIMLVAAAEALASEVNEEDLAVCRIYPPRFSVSASVAASVALSAYELGLATKFPRPTNFHQLALEYIYKDVYP